MEGEDETSPGFIKRSLSIPKSFAFKIARIYSNYAISNFSPSTKHAAQPERSIYKWSEAYYMMKQNELKSPPLGTFGVSRRGKRWSLLDSSNASQSKHFEEMFFFFFFEEIFKP